MTARIGRGNAIPDEFALRLSSRLGRDLLAATTLFDVFADHIDDHIGGGGSSSVDVVTAARLTAYARHAIANGA